MSTSKSRTVGELVAERPARARVFERFGIDYCCGGKLSLAEAAAQQSIDAAPVLAALREADQEPAGDDGQDWNQTSLAGLIDHILATHHDFLRRELPRLNALAEKVDQVHRASHPELTEVRQVFAEVRDELEMHMMKEERMLFPLIRNLEVTGSTHDVFCGSVQHPIRVMEMEHQSAGSATETLRRLTGGYAAPADACNSYRALLAGLAEFETDLHLHVHKENNILFPRAVALEAQCAAVERTRD